MTQPDTLHDRIRTELDRRLVVARSAAPAWTNIGAVVEAGPDGVPFVASDYVVAHIALHDPADAVRRHEGELEVLERHIPWDVDAYRYGITCKGCPNSAVNWPCIEIKALAHRLGVSVDG